MRLRQKHDNIRSDTEIVEPKDMQLSSLSVVTKHFLQNSPWMTCHDFRYAGFPSIVLGKQKWQNEEAWDF